MTINWLKMRTCLWTHPKVVRIVSALCPQNVRKMSNKAEVIGALFRLWTIGQEHTTDGRLDGYTPEVLDSEVGHKGFTQAVADVGWLVIDDNSLVIKDFDSHNGEGAKRRALDAERKRNVRRTSAERPQKNGQIADQKRREEKRREDTKTKKKKAPLVVTPEKLPVCLDTKEFRKSFDDWIEHHKQIKLPMTPLAVTKLVNRLEAMGHDRSIKAINHSIANLWKGVHEEDSANGGPSGGPSQGSGGRRRSAEDRGEYPETLTGAKLL